MKKLITLALILICLSSFAQVITTKIVKVANSTTLFNENLVKDIEILDIANKRIYLTLKAIPANKSISTCIIDVDLKELQSNVVRAKNGLYIVSNDLRDTIKLGGTLTEPTTISQNGRTFKILDSGHGSVFSQSGIAYTKIDTASFGDSTLITKLYAKKYKLKKDSVLPSGYATNYKVDEFFVPYNNALRDVNLGNRNITSTQQNIPINVGVVVMPTHVKNGDGTITLGSNGTYNFAKSADGSTGIAQKVVVSGTTITLTDNAVNFVYVDYNGGNPVYATSLDNMIFKDDFTKVPIIRATREGTAVHFEEYDLYGLLLANKLMVKDVYLNGGRRLSGLILSTAATRISTISAGSSVFAVQYYDNMPANIAGTAGSLYEYYLSSGVWNRSLVTSYDATYYSDGTNRQTLGNNKWVAKYYFRDIGDDNEAYYVHGHEYNNKSDAVNELIPAIPPVMAAHSVYVGKIVVEKNALNGTAYPRIWEGSVQNEGTSVHSDLSAESLVWSASGHTGTINNIAVFNGTGSASYTPNNSTNWNTAYTHSQNDTDLSPTNEANTSLTYNQTTRVLSVTDPVATRSATLPLATTTVDGLMSKEDKTKLNTIPLIYKNGIYKDLDTIKLGGVLTEDTDINVNDKYLSVYGNDKGLYINKNKSEIYVENDSTYIYMGLDEKYAYINNDSYDSHIGNLGSRINLFGDTIFITSTRGLLNDSQHHLTISNDKHEDFFYKYHDSEFEVKRGTVQDTTGIKYVNIPTAYFQDSTLVPKYYVDGLVGGTQTLSTNGSAGNISISSGNTITLNVNDHINRTALDNVSGVNTGDQTLSSLGAQPQLNGTGFVRASGTTISYDSSTYEPAFSKNTAFNKNFGTTTGTVLEGRTFGTAANNNTGDFILNQNSSAQTANGWITGAFDASGYKLSSTSLLLDWLKSGSAPASGNIVVGNGTTTNPSGVSVNQAIGGGLMQTNYIQYWDGSKLANASVTTDGSKIAMGAISLQERLNIAGNIKMESEAPYIELRNSNWALSSYIQAGVNFNGTTLGDYLSILLPSGKNLSFSTASSPNSLVEFLSSGAIKTSSLSGSGTRLVSATSDGTLGSNNITTDASNNLSGINNLTVSGDARINSLASDDKAEVSVFPDGTLTRKSIAPYIASSTSYTLNVAANVNAQLSATSNITITLSNIFPGERGVIEVVYTGASVVTFIVNSTLTLQIENSIYNSTTNSYTKSVLSKSSGSAKYEYYRSGNNVFIDGKQNYQ